jgi:glycolate oxidase FAD binding subunit
MIIAPTTEEEVAVAVREARALGEPLVVEGGGTRAGLGRPVQAPRTLSLKNLSGITLYEPSEMVIGAWAGTPLALVEETLAAKGQMLAFEPMNHQWIYQKAGTPTIGAVAACNNSGSRRVYGGACRDSLIGVRFVNGDGEIIKSGGRVMKNVTGLDLVKLHAGAFGTLGVLTQVIFKVIPRSAVAATVRFAGLSDDEGVALLCAAMGTPYEVTGAVHLPVGLGADEARTLLRIEGFPEQISYRFAALAKRFADSGKAELLEGASHDTTWEGLKNAVNMMGPETRYVWRMSVPAPKGAEALKATVQGDAKNQCRWFFDWSGGLIWLSSDAHLPHVHAVASQFGGHATLVRAPDAVRAASPVFQPLAEPVMALQRAVKASHDPQGLINPGRMYAQF